MDTYKVSFSVRHFFLAVLLVACPAIAQTQSEALPGYSVLSPGLSNQNFYCHTGYTLADCRQEVAELARALLVRYPARRTRSLDMGPGAFAGWIPISVALGLKPESPAFTAVNQQET